MLQAILIGNLGADCEKKEANGRKFTTARVAHNERWTDATGAVHESTSWVDIVLNDWPNVADYLKAGTTVFVIGNMQTRVYSSQKDRCMKAGVTISVRHIELVGGRTETVPSRLYDANGNMHEVAKFYHTDVAGGVLMSQRGAQFAVDDNGWVFPMQQAQAMMQAEDAQAQTEQQPAAESSETIHTVTTKRGSHAKK